MALPFYKVILLCISPISYYKRDARCIKKADKSKRELGFKIEVKVVGTALNDPCQNVNLLVGLLLTTL